MVLNEVYTGAGLSATMIPETEIALHEGNQIGTTVNSNNLLKTTKAKTTLSSGYTSGATSLALTDAGDFPGDGSNGGTGYINGDEFTYASKSGNTLTVANLGKNYASGVDITGTLLKAVEWDLKGSDGNSPASDNLAVNSLVENIYKGCYAKLDKYNSSGVDQTSSQTLVITGNTANTVTFGQSLSTTGSDLFKCTILQYGSPLYAPSTVYNTTNVLADNWLGLVNTITPPTVEAEPKQVNLALGGTRNFGFQFKGAETLGEASIDVSLNHGAWLYYALGQMTFSATQSGSDVYTQTTDGSADGYTYFHTANNTLHRKEGDVLLPPNTDSTLANYKKWDGNKIAYTFTEANSGDLPSFALEVTNEKGNTTYSAATTNTDHFSRIYTGCQINTLTLNFEEGQDVKATVGAVSRKAHDAPLAYIPKRNETSPSELFNYSSTDTDNNPYMFSDGTIKIYGQTMARIKSGSVTITNSLTPQRFIGNYDRTVTSAHIAGQRLYELNLMLLITDRTMWDEIRKQNETTGTGNIIDIEFAKSDDDKINLKFDNYLTTSVDIPFPDDKGPLEVNMIVQPRTLNACTYTGKWVIQG